MKTSKFLIAENPMVDDHRIFIIHTRHPYVLAEAFHFSENQEAEWMEAKSQFEIGTSVNYPGELICIGAIYYNNNCDHSQLPGLMRRMGDWYHAYMKWEDNNILNNENI